MAKALRAAKAKAPKMEAAAQETSGPEVARAAQGQDAPSSGAATGTNTSSESDDQGGAGDAAGSAGPQHAEFFKNPDESVTIATLDDALDALGGQGEHLDTEAEFRARFPRMSAELDAWKAENGDQLPAGLRIRSKLDGFRRAGIAHSKAPVEHQIGAFKGPEQLEALFAEPNLKVELF
ncbi:HI1506-related protein [Mesorhizobium sp. WSM3626]|uniref:HI1506-related protein n=1 Tax=Mesorhizobium sp. WSM3626 TaxID=1040987 RepID=UPI000484019D|nr:HI1506-related protein [Mesorhizobium sp. WSM3626]